VRLFAVLAILSFASCASARPRTGTTVLEIKNEPRDRVRVFIGSEQVSLDVAPSGALEATLRGTGLQRLRLQFVHGDRTSTHEVLVVLGASTRLVAMRDWGVRIVARGEGARCGDVRGGRGTWFLCDGHQPLPRGTMFTLQCGAPAAMASETYFYLDRTDAESVVSPSFLPTAPGLYRGEYANGKIAVTYTPHGCAGALALEPS
jgi:hypothetical protein